MIDYEKISPPVITLSEEAAAQLHLMIQNDPSFQDQCLRIHIQSKGCEGFRYTLGTGKPLPQDFVVKAQKINFHLDPFCAFYFQEGMIDYLILESGEDGFTVTSTTDTEKYKKKFWKKNPELIPPQRQKSSHSDRGER